MCRPDRLLTVFACGVWVRLRAGSSFSPVVPQYIPDIGLGDLEACDGSFTTEKKEPVQILWGLILSSFFPISVMLHLLWFDLLTPLVMAIHACA